MALIHDVANLAGVSVSTVSKALGGGKYSIRESTRKRVADAARALGYVNLAGEASAGNKTILVVTGKGGIRGIIKGLYDAAEQMDYRIIFIDESVCGVQDYAALLEEGDVCGAVFINLLDEGRLAQLSEKYPVVQCGEYAAFPKSVSVSINNEKAAYEITEMLIKQGRRRIALINAGSFGDYKFNMTRERRNGFINALSDYDLECVPELMLNSAYNADLRPIMALAKSLAAMDEATRPDAVVCDMTLVGAACVNAFRVAGIDVPGQVAVATFDDTPFSVFCDPELTCVSHPYETMGTEALRLLDSIIGGELTSGKHVYLEHEIVIRGSTAAENRQ